jgi:osmotically-inducible protein OsmY
MKGMFLGLALVFVASAIAQQQPYPTPPTFPQDQTRQQMPPDTKGLTTAQVHQQIQDKITSEPALANTNVEVKTDERSVTLTGTVDSQQQRNLAERIARSYAGDRKIVNKIKVAERT